MQETVLPHLHLVTQCLEDRGNISKEKEKLHKEEEKTCVKESCCGSGKGVKGKEAVLGCM